MSYKKFIFFCLVLCVLSISSVSASDNAQQDVLNSADAGFADVSHDDVNVLGESEIVEVSGNFTNLDSAVSSSNHIVLTGDVSRVSGENDIHIKDKSVLIEGNGYAINANDLGRAFVVLQGAELVLSNVKIINANSLSNTTQLGGSILNFGSLSVNDCIFENNHGGFGGAIASASNSITTISGINSFTRNNAQTCGGAISITDNATLKIQGKNIFEGNEAADGGGALYLNTLSNVSLLDHSYFYSNAVRGSRGSGGAILAVSNSPLSLKGHVFSGNTAIYGGAIFANETPLNVMYNIFSDNFAAAFGSDINLANSTVDSLNMNYWGSQSKPNSNRVYNYDTDNIESWVILQSVIPSEITQGQNIDIVNFVQNSGNPLSGEMADFEVRVTPNFNPNPLIISKNIGYSTYEGDLGNVIVSISGPGFVNSKSVKVVDGSMETVLSGSSILMFSGESKYFVVTLMDKDANVLPNQNIRILLKNNSFLQTTNGLGQVSLLISNLTPGHYPIEAIFDGTKGYVNSSLSRYIMVFPRGNTNTRIYASNITMFYKDGTRYVATLTDNNGNPLVGMPVKLLINGLTYDKITNATGQVSSALNLRPGEYNISSYFQGNDAYSPVFVTNSLVINPTIIAPDFTKYYKNGTQYYATVKDSTGAYLPEGTEISMNINGVFYKRSVTGNMGLVKLTINLLPGDYILTATNPTNGETAATNIKVLGIISDNTNITKYYRNDTQYIVRLLDDNGNPVSGAQVTFNINGVFYTRTSNASGFATLKINLPEGNYIITATYRGYSVSNSIKVFPVLSARDLNKRAGGLEPFTATLLNGTGKPYENQTVTFNINGRFYYRTTDDKGIAKLNINLPAGIYIITSSYNGCNIGNKVTVYSWV